MKQLKATRKLLILATICISQIAAAQNRTVRGTLTLFNTYPVGGVEIQSKKLKSGVKTNSEGHFILECAEKDQIVIKDRLFQPVNLRVTDKDQVIVINMIFKDTPKNRKLAVSQGYIAEEDLIYGLENLQFENNDYCTYADVFTLIRGKFSDVEVRNIPGGGQGVYIRRGQKSLLEDTQTLYIVDGMKVENLSFVNPCEIASIKILKEGKAAIYGAGSRDGAVVIETK